MQRTRGTEGTPLALPPPLVLIPEAPGGLEACSVLSAPTRCSTPSLWLKVILSMAFWRNRRKERHEVVSIFVDLGCARPPPAGRALSRAFSIPSQLQAGTAPPAAGCARPGRPFNLPVVSFPHLLRGDNVFEGDLPPREAYRLNAKLFTLTRGGWADPAGQPVWTQYCSLAVARGCLGTPRMSRSLWPVAQRQSGCCQRRVGSPPWAGSGGRGGEMRVASGGLLGLCC